ncbi:Nuclear HMG-like acidic protein Mak16 [Bonamia ostreae]|uniref:Protein MAK16 homolog n=1 Tax=Bonamia ostreae TaxID=126728 RepID=A0ABV2AHE9_9EUKA
MQRDEVIWNVIGTKHCSFRAKQRSQNFCRHKKNATGICDRLSCPLANSRYATVLHGRDGISLHIKVVERAHSPNKLWERVLLPENDAEALKKIEKELLYWPEKSVERCKKRFVRTRQYMKRIEKLKRKNRALVFGVKKKIERREKRREEKAQLAAKITKNIKKELIERLNSNIYDEEIVNIPAREYDRVLDEMALPENEFVADFESENDLEDLDEMFDDIEAAQNEQLLQKN